MKPYTSMDSALKNRHAVKTESDFRHRSPSLDMSKPETVIKSAPTIAAARSQPIADYAAMGRELGDVARKKSLGSRIQIYSHAHLFVCLFVHDDGIMHRLYFLSPAPIIKGG